MAKKKIKTDITVVLPVHELANENDVTLFKGAITSVTEQTVKPDEILIVVPKGSEVETTLKDFDFGDAKDMVRIISNPGNSDFQTQINYGVENVKTEWFSFLELDDEYSDKWFSNVVKYREAHDDVDIFLPIIVDVSADDGMFMGLTNEAAWANSFSDELGFLDNNALLAFQNFNIDGMTMRKSTFDDLGGFKSNIKLTFIYEFLLRMTFNAARVMVIPRYGYKHVNQREGSLFASYKEEMNPTEANWWLAQAKKEYYYPNEREIIYEETSN
jgi:glycosyltransferase involved in cell wall biosynthesis